MAEHAEDGNKSLLRGVVLCSTSLSQDLRDKLNELAKNMGAILRLDLTVDVTHLIVGNINTPKCKHTAKERPDIHVLRPEWIHAMRKSYMDDLDIDVDAMVHKYRLPPFHNLRICVSGFEDVKQRQDLIQNICDNGARYHGDLTKEVTHLVVATPKGAKYERARSWNITTVSLKWLQESLERGMAVDELLYDPLMLLDDQGRGAFVRDYQRPPVLGKRQRGDPAITSTEGAGKRKMRRTASARLADHSQSMMTSVLSPAGDEQPDITADQWTDSKDDTPDRVLTRHGTPPRPANDVSRPASRGPDPLLHQEEQGLFSRVLCLVHGHGSKKASMIHDILNSNGGKRALSADALYSALDDNSTQHIVLILPSEWTSLTKGPLPEVPSNTWLVTEWWLERCIKQKTILDPNHDLLSQPHLGLPIDGFEDMSIATSGMGHDVLHISKVVRLAGALYDETLLPKTRILMVPGPASNPEKLAYAAKHKISVVSDKWLFSCLLNVRKMPLCDYAVVAQSRQTFNHHQSDRASGEGSAPPPPYKR